jgi:phosphoserine aminotransferase
MAMWSMLGARPVTMLAWESFGEGWVTDVEKQLKLKDVTVLKAPYGEIPNLSKVDPATDVVSRGTARRPACACRTRTGSQPTAKA